MLMEPGHEPSPNPLVTDVASFEAESIRAGMCATGRCKNEGP
jgi:hypothetical protein